MADIAASGSPESKADAIMGLADGYAQCVHDLGEAPFVDEIVQSKKVARERLRQAVEEALSDNVRSSAPSVQIFKLLERLDRERVYSINAVIRRMQSPGTATGKKADEMHQKWEAAYAKTLGELEATLEAERAHFDTLRQTLEIIAVGDSKDPAVDAAQALRAVGFWKKEAARA